MRVLDIRLEMSSDSKNHFGFLVEAMSEPGLTINSPCYWHLENFCPDYRARSQIGEMPGNRKSRKNVRCSFRNVNRFQRSFWFSS